MRYTSCPSFVRFTRRLGVMCAALGLAFAPTSAGAEVAEEELLNPNDPTDVWGKKITGLGANGDETALVFTKTGETLNWTLPDGVKSIRYLVVGGGGGGGACFGNSHSGGGGGGAGGLLANEMSVASGATMSIAVGAGGAGVTQSKSNTSALPGTNGVVSVLQIGDTTLTALGGSGGGSGHYKKAAPSGGCGGGGSAGYAGGDGSQGGNGGTSKLGTNNNPGGGGGGAGGNGGDSGYNGTNIGGYGGDGVESDITGEALYYAGGGAGGSRTSTSAQGGKGGGGRGGRNATGYKAGGNATFYGGGGGGTFNNPGTGVKGGNGYQGVVIVRYRVMAANEVSVPTIAAKDYNGALQKADIADGPGYYVSANAGGADAGDYVVTLALSNNFVWVGGSTDPTNLIFTINKINNSWTTEPSLSKTTWAMDAEPAIVNPGVPASGTEVVVTYDDDEILMPTNVGSHTAYFNVAESKNHFALAAEVDYEVTKRVNSWTTQPVVSSFNIEDPAPVFTPPTSKFGEVVAYYDGDPDKTEMPTDLGQHSVTYKVLEGGDYTAFEQTIVYAVTYKPIVDQNDPSKVLGYRLPKLGAEQNEVALVFTTVGGAMNYALPQYVTSFSYLICGGGAGGGACSGNWYTAGGGGGAGAVLTNTVVVAAGSMLSLTVGAGGAGAAASNARGVNGGASSLQIGEAESLVALGGGGGGSGHYTSGANGGCGGGASYTGSAGQGNGGFDGGTSGCATTSSRGGGGGGGGATEMGANGSAASGYLGGKGGDGVWSSISDVSACYGGGGSGGNGGKSTSSPVSGGAGGGGRGGSNTNARGGDATSFGGGGGGGYNGNLGGNGYQGVVIIRYVEDATAVAVPVIKSKVYTGELQTAEVPSSFYYTVTANDGGTDVGEYPVELTLATGYHWDGGTAEPTNLVFVITQGQNEWTVEPSISKDNWLTTDEPGVITNGVTRFGEVTRVIVKDGGAAEPFVSMPTAAGVYVITNIAPATTANYLAPEVTEKTVSFTIFGASETPDFTVSFNGDVSVGANDGVVTSAVPYRVSCDVESPKLVNIHALVTLDGAAATDVTLAENVALDAAGFGLLNDLKPGAAYDVALYGLGVEDGKSSPTTDVVHVTTPGPATGLSASATFTNDPKEFVISGSLTPGLGTTTVYLRWSLNSGALDNLATYTFASGDAGAFSTNIAYTALSDSLTWDVAVSNNFTSSTYGDLSWNDALAATTKTRVDTVATTYTWTGNGGDNLWTNDANWTANRAESYGYPDNLMHAMARVTTPATIDLDGGTFKLGLDGLSASTSLGEVQFLRGTLVFPQKRDAKTLHDVSFGGSGTTLVFDEVVLSGFRGLKFVANSPVVFTGNTSQGWQYEPWGANGSQLIVRDGTMSSGFFKSWVADDRRHYVTITNAVWTINGNPSSIANRVDLWDGPDRQARFVSTGSLSLNWSWALAIPEGGRKLASIQAATCSSSADCAFEINVTDYKSGRKVPLVKFTGADQSETMTAKLEKTTLAAKTRKKNGDLVDVTAKRNARLVWSAEDNTLYYKQDAQLGLMVFVR